MHGPWHMPEHPDERDNSAYERAIEDAAEERRLEAHGYDAPLSLDEVDELDPRDPDYTKAGIFQNHNCWKCREGETPCVRGNPRQCEYPHARND